MAGTEVSDDGSVADTPKVPFAPTLWGGVAGSLPGSAASTSSRKSTSSKKGKGKKGKKEADAPEAPPIESNATVSLTFDPTSVFRDSCAFGNLEVSMFATMDIEHVTRKPIELGAEEDEGGAEKKDDGDAGPRQPTVTVNESQTALSRTNSRVTLSYEEEGLEVRKEETSVTWEVRCYEWQIDRIRNRVFRHRF